MTDGDVPLHSQHDRQPDGGEEGDLGEDGGDVDEGGDEVLQLDLAVGDLVNEDMQGQDQ